jgi:hypothetical protein
LPIDFFSNCSFVLLLLRAIASMGFDALKESTRYATGE